MVNTVVIPDWLPEALANGAHGHWATRNKKLKAAQVMVWASAKHAGLQRVEGRAKLTLTFVFPVKRRRDTDNLYSRAKGCVDGLVHGGWIKDDSIEWLDLHVVAEVDPGRKATRFELVEV